MNKVKWREGLYRIFVLLSFVTSLVCLIFYKSFLDLDYLWQGILISIFSGISVYILYFLLDWVISGFIQDDNINGGLKAFVKTIVNKINSGNYRIPFYFTMCFLSLAIVCNYFEIKKYIEYREEIKSYRASESYINDISTQCNRKLELCNYELSNCNKQANKKDKQLLTQEEIERMDEITGLSKYSNP